MIIDIVEKLLIIVVLQPHTNTNAYRVSHMTLEDSSSIRLYISTSTLLSHSLCDAMLLFSLLMRSKTLKQYYIW